MNTTNTILRDSLRTAFSEFGDRPLFSEERPFDKWMTYSEVGARSERLAAALCRLLDETAEDRPRAVCIYSRNRAAWLVSDFACALAGILSVGLHTSWPPEEAAHVLNETSAAVVIAGAAQLPAVFSVAGQCPLLRAVVSMDGAESVGPYSEAARRLGVRCLSFDDIPALCPERLEDCARAVDAFIARPEQRSPYATVIYSSGTTNTPKGLGVRKETWEADSRSGPFDAGAVAKVAVSSAPLAHGMDRGVVWQAVYCGGRVGFARSGDYADLSEDVRLIGPGVFVSMPNVWNRLYDDYRRRVRQLAAAALCGMLGVAADEGAAARLGRALDTLETMATSMPRDELARKYPFVSEIRATAMREARGFLGGRASVIGTGGDFTSDEVLAFLRECYAGATVVNSYGTTEVPGIASNGVINSAAVEVKLVDAPEAGCLTTDKPAPRGEIVCRNRRKWMETRYWGDSELARALSAAAFRDGWYHTGDLGSIDPATGRLTLLGRTRDVAEIYLGGRSVWIPLSKIEPVFRSCDGVRNIYVHSDRSQEYLIAVVSVININDSDPEQDAYDMLCKLRKAGHAAGLRRHEIPKSVILTTDSWTPQSGDLSATGKLRRGRLGARYKAAIDAEYARLEAVDEELAEFRRRLGGDRSFDYIRYDFAARPQLHRQDGARLAEIYRRECEVIGLLRVKGPAATARLKAREGEIRASIRAAKEAMLGECERAAEGGNAAAAVDGLRALGKLLRLRHKELLAAERSSDPEVAELMRAFAGLGDELRAAADEMGVDVPYQITAGIVVKPPAPPGGAQVSALPESEGLPSWRTDCACCGDLIEWGSAGAGTPRYKCMSCSNQGSHSAQSLCADCYRVLSGLAAAGADAAERVRAEIVPCFALGHVLVEETLNTLWIREKIFVLSDHRLGTTLRRAFEWYGGRPCVGSAAPGNGFAWATYREVWEKARSLAAGLGNAGVRRGSVVCLADEPATRALLWPACEFGCALAGCALCVVGRGERMELPPNTAAVIAETALSCGCRTLAFSELVGTGAAEDLGDDGCSAPEEVFAVGANPQGEFVAYRTEDVWKRLNATPEFDEPYVQVVMGSSVTMPDRLRLWDAVLNGGRLGVVDPAEPAALASAAPTKVVLALADPATGSLQFPQSDASFEEKAAFAKARFGGRVEKVVLDVSYTPTAAGGGDKEEDNETARRVESLCRALSIEFSAVRGFDETGYVTTDGALASSRVSVVEENLVSVPGMATEYYMNDELTKKRFLHRDGKLYFVAPKGFI